jgi:hypothetical protein
LIAYYFMWRTGQPAAGQCEGDFMPWYSVQDSADVLLAERPPGRMYLACYLRPGDRVYETYWTTVRGVEAMDSSYALLDLTAHGRQETWEDSPAGWPQPWEVSPRNLRTVGRPTAQPSRLAAGRSDDLAQPTLAQPTLAQQAASARSKGR